MKNAEQAMEFIDNTLNGLEKSIIEKKDTEVFQAKQRFNTLISEYGNMLGTKNVSIYTKNYSEIMQKGGYLK